MGLPACLSRSRPTALPRAQFRIAERNIGSGSRRLRLAASSARLKRCSKSRACCLSWSSERPSPLRTVVSNSCRACTLARAMVLVQSKVFAAKVFTNVFVIENPFPFFHAPHHLERSSMTRVFTIARNHSSRCRCDGGVQQQERNERATRDKPTKLYQEEMK